MVREDRRLRDAFEDLYAQWRQAMTVRDVDWALRVEHPNFRYTGSEGQRKGRADHVRQITSASNAEFRTTLLTVDRYGIDTVVVTGDHSVRADVEATQAGLPDSIVEKMRKGIRYAFTSVWIRDADQWRLVAHHTSEVQATEHAREQPSAVSP